MGFSRLGKNKCRNVFANYFALRMLSMSPRATLTTTNTNTKMTNYNYNVYYTRVFFHNAFSKVIEIVAIDEEAAKADIIEAYGSDSVAYIAIARLRAA